MQACIATGPVSFRGIIKKSCELAFEMSLRKLKIMHKDKKCLCAMVSQWIFWMIVCEIFYTYYIY